MHYRQNVVSTIVNFGPGVLPFFRTTGQGDRPWPTVKPVQAARGCSWLSTQTLQGFWLPIVWWIVCGSPLAAALQT